MTADRVLSEMASGTLISMLTPVRVSWTGWPLAVRGQVGEQFPAFGNGRLVDAQGLDVLARDTGLVEPEGGDDGHHNHQGCRQYADAIGEDLWHLGNLGKQPVAGPKHDFRGTQLVTLCDIGWVSCYA